MYWLLFEYFDEYLLEDIDKGNYGYNWGWGEQFLSGFEVKFNLFHEIRKQFIIQMVSQGMGISANLLF